MTMADQSYSVHQCAVDAEAALEKLATELAHAGIDPQAVAVVSKMADVTRKLVKELGQGQEQTANTAPPAPAPQQHTIASATDALHQHLMAQNAGR